MKKVAKVMRPLKVFPLIFLLLLLPVACHRLPPPPVELAQSWGEQKSFDYQGIKINYYEAGLGPPVILLHGFGGAAYSWRFLIPALATDYRVFTLDLKGFGLSGKPEDGKYAVRDQAEMVAAFLRAHNLREAVLIGNSMGGGVALMTYLQLRGEKPERIKGLVLIDSAGYPQKLPVFIRMARTPMGELGAGLLSPRVLVALVLRKSFYNQDKITEEAINTYASYGSLPGAAYAVRQTAIQIIPGDMEALIAQYKTITVPCLIIWGQEDQIVPLQNARNFKRDLSNSELAILPKCGHIPQEEEPQETQRLIRDFLKNR